MTDYKLVSKSIVDELAQFIRQVDGNNRMGAGALADKICERFRVDVPAVQRESIGFCEDTALSLAERTFSYEVDEQLAEDVIQYAQRLHTLYTAPQPAEQQPCPEDIREGTPYDDLEFESLCREHEIWGTAAAAQCAVFWEAGKRVAEQQPSPAAAALVEALEQCITSMLDSGYRANALVIRAARSALAAHRKGGEV